MRLDVLCVPRATKAVAILAGLAVCQSAAATTCPEQTVGFDGGCRDLAWFEGLAGGTALRVDGSGMSDGHRAVITLLRPDGSEVLTITDAPGPMVWTGPMVGPYRVLSQWSRTIVEGPDAIDEVTTTGQDGPHGWSEEQVSTSWPGTAAATLDAIRERAALDTAAASAFDCVGSFPHDDDEPLGVTGDTSCSVAYASIGPIEYAILWWLDQECDVGNEVTIASPAMIMCTTWLEPLHCMDFYVYETTAECGLEQTGFYTTCECPEEIPDWT